MTETTIVIADDVNIHEIPRRSYDFDKGDRRFTDPERAYAHAEAKALETGVRQVVRKDSSPHFVEFWLVQEVGS